MVNIRLGIASCILLFKVNFTLCNTANSCCSSDGITCDDNSSFLCKIGCVYGEYVMIDEKFGLSLWPMHEEMGYAYYQLGFDNFAEMLEWSYDNMVDFGWKEGSSYGQLFYKVEEATEEVIFDSELTALLPSSDCWDFESNDFDSRMAFVRKDVLENHPAFKGTSALLDWQKCNGLNGEIL